MEFSMFVQMLLNGLQLASVYILVALGFTLIFGILHIVNIAHSSIFMIGAYATWVLLSLVKMNYIAAIIVVILFVSLLGIALERVIFRRISGLAMPTVIASMGLTWVINQSMLLGFGTREKVLGNPFPGVIRILGAVFPVQRLVILLIAAALAVLLVWWVQKSRRGLAMRAVALDREAAALHGISHERYGTLAFAIGCALAGAAGALVAPLFYMQPYMGDAPLMKCFICIIVGGLGSIPGAILAGILLGLIDSFVATLVDSAAAALLGFALAIAILIFKPTGFFGHD